MVAFGRRLLQAMSLGSSSDNDEAATLAPKPRPDPAGPPAVPEPKAKFDIEVPGISTSAGQPLQPRLDPVQHHQPRPDPLLHLLGAPSSLPAVILPCPPSLPSLGASPGSLGPSLGQHDEAMLLWDPEGFGLGDDRMNGSCTDGVCEKRRSKRRRPTPQLQTPMMDAPLFSLSRILEYGIGGACFTALTGISAANTSRHGTQVVVCSMLDGRTSYEAALHIARRRILSAISDDLAFYLGITENPARRFSDHIRHWDQYIILVEAGSSRITASMEIALLRELGGRRGCHNVGLGGETASAGSPHYLYLCASTMSLLRRRPVHGSSRQ